MDKPEQENDLGWISLNPTRPRGQAKKTGQSARFSAESSQASNGEKEHCKQSCEESQKIYLEYFEGVVFQNYQLSEACGRQSF